MFFICETSCDSSDDEKIKKQNLVLEKKLLRQKSNIFNLPDKKFEKYFRLSKEAFKTVLEKISPILKSGKRTTFISPINKLASTLRFLAQGSYQLNVGNDFNLGLSQPMVSKILSETLNALEIMVCPQWIKFEMTAAEKNDAKLSFFVKTGFPGVIGCVDGTHIKIIAPNKEDQHLYLNRKGFFSLNAMIICDHKMRIRFLDARYAGSIKDSFIWNGSRAKAILQEQYDSGERNSWLLGDSEYPLEPYLMTPYRYTEEGSEEAIFNTKHAEAKNIVERTIGVLKNRFRCLLGERRLHYKPEKATKIVNVCAALHNICIEYGITYEDASTEENSQPDVEVHDIEELTERSGKASEIRNQLKQSFL